MILLSGQFFVDLKLGIKQHSKILDNKFKLYLRYMNLYNTTLRI